jgi:hypothetical protein
MDGLIDIREDHKFDHRFFQHIVKNFNEKMARHGRYEICFTLEIIVELMDAIILAKHCWDFVSQQTIENCFKKSGFGSNTQTSSQVYRQQLIKDIYDGDTQIEGDGSDTVKPVYLKHVDKWFLKTYLFK